MSLNYRITLYDTDGSRWFTFGPFRSLETAKRMTHELLALSRCDKDFKAVVYDNNKRCYYVVPEFGSAIELGYNHKTKEEGK